MDDFSSQLQCEDVCGEAEYYAAQEWAAECERERQRELQDRENELLRQAEYVSIPFIKNEEFWRAVVK